MKILTLHTFEDVHHICLMNTLKYTYSRFPYLVNNIMATPPPIRRKPERTGVLLGMRRNPVNVQYYKNIIQILYDETKTNQNEMETFAKVLMEDYLALRHPYMKIAWEEARLKDSLTGRLISEIFG